MNLNQRNRRLCSKMGLKSSVVPIIVQALQQLPHRSLRSEFEVLWKYVFNKFDEYEQHGGNKWFPLQMVLKHSPFTAERGIAMFHYIVNKMGPNNTRLNCRREIVKYMCREFTKYFGNPFGPKSLRPIFNSDIYILNQIVAMAA